MSSHGLIEISEAIGGSYTLQDLDLSHNHMDDKAALILARAVAFNHNLKRLVVEGNTFGAIGMDALARTTLRLVPAQDFVGVIDFGRGVLPAPPAHASAVYSLCEAAPLSELHASLGSPLLLDMREIWHYTIAAELYDAVSTRGIIRFEARSPQTRAAVDFSTFDSPNTFDSLRPLGVLAVAPARTDPPAVPPIALGNAELDVVRHAALGVQLEAQREMLLGVVCRNRMLKGTQPARLLALLDTRVLRVNMAAQMVRAYDPTAALDWVRSALDGAEQSELALAHGAHPFEPDCPTGHYRLDLSKCVHARIAACLQLLNARDIQERLERAKRAGARTSPFRALCGCKVCAVWPADTTMFGGQVTKSGTQPGDCWRHATLDWRPLLPHTLVRAAGADETLADQHADDHAPIALPKPEKIGNAGEFKPGGVSAWALPSEGVLDLHYVSSCAPVGSLPLPDDKLRLLLADVVAAAARVQPALHDDGRDGSMVPWTVALRERCAHECFSCQQVEAVLEWAKHMVDSDHAALRLQEEIVVILFRRSAPLRTRVGCNKNTIARRLQQ